MGANLPGQSVALPGQASQTARWGSNSAGQRGNGDMEILTGMPAGRRGPDGTFPAGTLYALVDARLAEMARLAASWMPGMPARAGQG